METNLNIDAFTKYVLSTYKKDITQIDLRPLNFKKLSCYESFKAKKGIYRDLVFVGYLDLINFPNLKEINCSENEITQIINMPNINKLICSRNKIYELDYLPNTLEYLDCSYNNLLSNLDNLPSSIKYLDCSNCNIENLNSLPYELEELKCQSNKNANLDILPSKLQTLRCDNILELKEIPDSLITIYVLDIKSNYENTKKELNENFRKIRNHEYKRCIKLNN
jgi:Leucine-rich repeat (LRR) protein